MNATPPPLSVTSLSQFVRLDNCERFLRFRLHPDEERSLLRKWHLTDQPLTPLLKDSGAEYEQQVIEHIAARGEPIVRLDHQPLDATVQQLRTFRKPTILIQARLEAPLGGYLLNGRADVLRLERDARGNARVLVADVKASRRERMEHRLQVAIYARLLRLLAAEHGVPLARLDGSVLHIQPDGTMPPLDPETPTFDLDTFDPIIDHLVAGPDSVVSRVAARPFPGVPYHLSYKCDGCLYNAICMHDSAERLDLSLVPYISPVEKRVLQEAGVTTLPQLANLMQLPAPGQSELTVSPGQEALYETLNNQWPVGPSLPLLVQRARRALRRFDPTIESVPFLYGGGFGTLPSDDEHPDLVKIFFDAQRDYLQDRLCMVAALVKGPRGERIVVHSTDGPPTADSERNLLVRWVADVIAAGCAVAAGPQAPVHLYCYNRYDQKVLLEALKRHLEHVAALPAFFDLLTQSPALEQPIISFLSAELQERANLGLVCTPLHDAARARGFDWQDGRYRYFELFRARLFDNRRDVIRLPDGSIHRADGSIARDDPRRITIESASRFNSQIPLEYAYGAWGRLPADREADRALEPFRRVTLDQLRGFAAHRTRALAHIEASFKNKARFLDKPPVSLPDLTAPAGGDPALDQSLEEFLHMEHHAALQATLQVYSLPVERRVQTGLALFLRYQGPAPEAGLHRFTLAYEDLGLDPVLMLNSLRLREGDWVVLNRAGPAPSATKIKNGRLAVIEAIGTTHVDLRLMDTTFRGSRFRYPHDRQLAPQAGLCYVVDQMADDLNADKALEALHNLDTNALYRWLLYPPPPRPVPPALEEALDRFAGQVNAVEGATKRLTPRQREVVAGRLADPIFLVQGPPGTGKSQTLSWAVLGRVAARAAQGLPCRVAVCCKTHNAVNIVLGAIARNLRRLTGIPTPLTRPLHNLPVYKLVNDSGDDLPAGVAALNAYQARGQALEAILAGRSFVIGGTPGGLYNLGRYRELGGRSVVWSAKSFDLIVIDEASQMSLPEGVLAAAFLEDDGSAIVVGDHRQMPPIVAHDWDDEDRRTITATRPYLSLFEFLLERGIPRVALDESFRLHRTIAGFLQENVYVRDGIRFFSRREELLSPPPPTDPFASLVLDPAYPIVVVEHGEQRSRQYNETEIALVTPLIELCARKLRLDGRDGIGVVVPHRAQKALLRQSFPELAVTDSIDTVERFQGGERDVIIVSATASDPDYVLAEAGFLLNLNRLNVALSRPRKKLIVVASESVVNLLTSDLDIFENAAIWKRLYYQYAADILWEGERGGIPVRVRGRRAG